MPDVHDVMTATYEHSRRSAQEGDSAAWLDEVPKFLKTFDFERPGLEGAADIVITRLVSFFGV